MPEAMPKPVLGVCVFTIVLHLLSSSGSCAPVELGQEVSCPNAEITVVYNALVWPDNDWQLIIKGQLLDLRNSGLASCSALYVVLSAPAVQAGFDHLQVEELLTQGRDVIYDIIPAREPGSRTGAIVTLVHENSFEYSGVHLLWLLASRVPEPELENHTFLYMHTKGMVYHGRLTSRNAEEVYVLNRTIRPWKHVINLFQTNQTITRVGLYPSPAGWVWFNFWWARASYIRTLVEPERSQNRFYFEVHLGRLHKLRTQNTTDESNFFGGCDTCFSLCTVDPGKTYIAEKAWEAVVAKDCL
jgi:hypothetical protein